MQTNEPDQPPSGIKICEHCKQQIIYYVDECQVPKPCGYVSLHSHCWQELGGPSVWNKPQPPSGKDLSDHKYLDAVCALDGCQSLVYRHQAEVYRKQMAEAEAELDRVEGEANADSEVIWRSLHKISPMDRGNDEAWLSAIVRGIERIGCKLTAANSRLAKVREKLKEIVVTEGCDAGVVLLSDYGPTHYDAELKCQIYDHAYFSPLGDALVELAALAEGEG